MESERNLSRREMLRKSACGFGWLAFTALAAEGTTRPDPASPLAPRPPRHPARARRVIHLYMEGGPSPMDTFDHKPALERHDGQTAQLDRSKGQSNVTRGRVRRSPFRFSPRGESGLWVSEIFPNLARRADDLCILNGVVTDSAVHHLAAMELFSGTFQSLRPSLGSWVLHGLGTENADLPGFLSINPGGFPRGRDYGGAFLPPPYHGTRLRFDPAGPAQPIRHLGNPSLDREAQRRQLDLLRRSQLALRERVGEDPILEGMIDAFELAFRMQASVPDLMDLRRESPETLALYGIDDRNPGLSDAFGRQCLMARRFAEAGVRFIQVTSPGWDHHSALERGLREMGARTDRPIAGLLADLGRRGLLEDTLVLWGGEFGRPPVIQNEGLGDDWGRDHNGAGFTCWMAGGGVRGGMRHGATDELGWHAVEGRVHVHDLHATALHLLGLDPARMGFRAGGREYRPNDGAGRVVTEILA